MLTEDEAVGTRLACYVYGVIDGSVPPPELDVRGLDGEEPVSTLAEGGIAAVISRVGADQFGEEELRRQLGDMQWVEHAARAHEAVVDHVFRRTAIVPMRMCTVYRTEGGVREMLRREARMLELALAALTGKAEWGVKVFADRERVRAAHVAEIRGTGGSGGSTATGAGAAYLQRRQRERDAAEEIDLRIGRAAAEIHELFCACARDGLVAPPQRPEVSGHAGEMVLNGVYLVETDAEAGFAETVRTVARGASALGLELELTGPWPAYNFVPPMIGATR